MSGIGVPQDTQSGAGWLLRAAEGGSPTAAFNAGVMYERGFVVERDPTRAIEWYQKAVDGNVAVAKHNLALMLRDGKGVPRDGKKAIELLQSAARQGMTGSMFLLGDIYERGDVDLKDAPLAMAWFAIAVEFERQANHAAETPLLKLAQQRVESLRRALTPAELDRAEMIGRAELQELFAARAPPKAEARPGVTAPPSTGLAVPPRPPAPSAPPPEDDEAIGWPRSAAEQVRTVQQVLIDLQRLNGKADGVLGPATRAAIIDFERSVGLRETGEASRVVYVAALRAIAQHDAVARSPLPPPPPSQPPKP
ncbi:MAG: SEL1-like repeat protein [Enhydrobacter sp.]|nr:SEL1-like repeat protein [Enhydrobacter sp.]